MLRTARHAVSQTMLGQYNTNKLLTLDLAQCQKGAAALIEAYSAKYGDRHTLPDNTFESYFARKH